VASCKRRPSVEKDKPVSAAKGADPNQWEKRALDQWLKVGGRGMEEIEMYHGDTLTATSAKGEAIHWQGEDIRNHQGI